MASTKRKSFSVEEKSVIIQRLEAGESNATIAKEFGVNHSTISTIKKNKHKIELLFNANVLKPKRVRLSSQERVGSALLQWYKLQHNHGIPVNGPMLQQKANFFAKELNILDFDCSASWINRFKKRHNIVAGKIAGSAPSMNETVDYAQIEQCSNCKESINGSVYICVQCVYVMCASCDMEGAHAHHYVLRAPPGRTRVPIDANICHPCFELLSSKRPGDMRLFGHAMICISCGCSVRNSQHHAVERNNSMMQNLLRSHPAFHQVMNYACHACWMRHQRRSNQDQNRLHIPGPEPRPEPEPKPEPRPELEPVSEPEEVQTVKIEVTEVLVPILEYFNDRLPDVEKASTSPVHTEVIKEELDIEENDPLLQLEMRQAGVGAADVGCAGDARWDGCDAPVAGTSQLQAWPFETKFTETLIKREIDPDEEENQPCLTPHTVTVESEPVKFEVIIKEEPIVPRKRKRKAKGQD